MSIIAWIVVGALAGWIASMISGTNGQQGWLMNIVIGVLGALVGGWLYGFLTGANFTAGFDILTVVVSVIGAIILLAIYKAVSARA